MSKARGKDRAGTFLERLLTATSQGTEDTALIFKHRGRRRSLTWRATLDEIDAITAGLSQLGVRPGGVVAIDGEITATLFLAAAAVRAIGGNILPIAPSATVDELERAVLDPSVQLTIGQGRETVAEWSAAAATGKRQIAIVLDHAVPGSRSPGENIVTIPQLRELAPKAGWTTGLHTGRSRAHRKVTWFEESTEWTQGIEAILEHWISSRDSVALPETLIAATRDRAEIAPDHWIASARRLEAAWLYAKERIPAEDRLAGRLAASALNDAGTPWHAIIRARLRRTLGLHRLRNIKFHDAANGLSHQPRAFFTALNLRLIGNEQQGIVEVTPAAREETSQFRDLALASAVAR